MVPIQMSIKTQSAKAKGRELQKAIRDRILEKFSWLGEGDVESTSMGASGVDIKMSPLARKAFPVSIEAKKTKKTPSLAELKQARSNTYDHTIGAVVWSPHGTGPDKAVIMMDFAEFLEWWYENQGKFEEPEDE